MFCADCMTLLMLAPSAAGFDSDVIGLGSIASKWCWWCGWPEAVSEDDMPPVCVVCCVGVNRTKVGRGTVTLWPRQRRSRNWGLFVGGVPR
jgi:hypothetical protein